MSKRRRHLDEPAIIVKRQKSLKAKSDKYFKKFKNSRNRSKLLTMFLQFLFVLVIGFGFFVYLVDQKIIFRSALKPSKIILGNANDIEEYLKIMEKYINPVDGKLLDDEITAFIKSNLARIQERLTSLTIQTAQYEQMSIKIPGGPRSFIISTEKELHSMMTDLLIVDEKISFVRDKNKKNQVEYSVGHIVFPKNEPLYSENLGNMILANSGVFLWPEVWESENKELAKKAAIDAVDQANFTLVECFEILETAAKVLYSLGKMYEEVEETYEETKKDFNLMTSMFPRPIALFIYRYIWQEDLTPADLGYMNKEDVHLFSSRITQAHDSLIAARKFYKEKEPLLRSIIILKLVYVDRAEEYVKKLVEETVERRSREKGSLFMDYVDLKTKIFINLGELRIRVHKLKGPYRW